jgi:hypothetical protein
MLNDCNNITEALTSPSFSHSRCRPWCGVMMCYIYHRDYSSPSGVWMIYGGEENKMIEEANSVGLGHKLSPLSPTEPR